MTYQDLGAFTKQANGKWSLRLSQFMAAEFTNEEMSINVLEHFKEWYQKRHITTSSTKIGVFGPYHLIVSNGVGLTVYDRLGKDPNEYTDVAGGYPSSAQTWDLSSLRPKLESINVFEGSPLAMYILSGTGYSELHAINAIFVALNTKEKIWRGGNSISAPVAKEDPVVTRKQKGICVSCEDPGEWRAMALMCRNGHGIICG